VDTRFPAATAGVAASLIRVPPIADLVSVLKGLSIVLRVGVPGVGYGAEAMLEIHRQLIVTWQYA
jgi:hypothetical protein